MRRVYRGGGMWYMYVLGSLKNHRLYIGYTGDLKRRFQEHNEARGGAFTAHNGPFELIFYEAFLHKKDALKAEKFFKSGYGKEVLKDKLEYFFEKVNKI